MKYMKRDAQSDPTLFYRQERTSKLSTLRKLKKYSGWLSLFRLALFVIAILSVVRGFKGADIWFYVALLLFLMFFISVVYSIFTKQRIRFQERLVQLNEDELKQLKLKKGLFLFRGDSTVKEDVRAQDLDFFGHAGIFSLLNRCITKQGEQKLAERLLGSSDLTNSYEQEQMAVDELSGYTAWRQKFISMRERSALLDSLPLSNWLAKGMAQSKLNLVWSLLRFVVPLLSVLVLVLATLGYVAGWLVLVWVVFNFMLLSLVSHKLFKAHTQLANYFNHIQSYRKLIKHISQPDFNGPILKDLQSSLSKDAEQAFASLERILAAFDNRLNMLVSIVLNGLFLWDIQCAFRLHNWHAKYDARAPQWLAMIEAFDVYVSLGNFAFNHPDFVYPQKSSEQSIEAEALGHPLIPDSERVCNDFSLRTGHIALVTGANMAGKSTFLRTIGVNYLLANAAVPVCARSFSFQPGVLLTSLRTSDSLERHESYFLAELRGIKHIVERVKEGVPHLFLIDEMLKGTNSKDKMEGSMAVIRNLNAHAGTGIIATHDLPVTKLAIEAPDTIHNLCFEIGLKGTEMFFNYHLQKGVTRNMNATLLLQNMGLIDERFFNKKQ
jgi:DNA mismatch repair ATPase MutS